MITEEGLREMLLAAVDDPAAEAYTLGLSDRALLAARGRGQRRWLRYAPGVAVGTAFAVAGTFGVLALAGGSGSGGGRVTASNVPKMAANPVANSVLLDFEVECFGNGGPKLAMDWVWDPATQQYRAVDGSVYTALTPSPDGERALVVQGVDTRLWGVADYADAVAGKVTYFSKKDDVSIGLRWTDDGKALTTTLAWTNGPNKDEKLVLANKTADFYDPDTGTKRSVPIPQAVLDGVRSGDWQAEQWQGDFDSVLFPMVSTSGDRMQWLDREGKVARTLALQDGLHASPPPNQYLGTWMSPDGRYLAESDGTVLATFDLKQGGRRVGSTSVAGGGIFFREKDVWGADNEIILAVDPAMKDAGKPDFQQPKNGHSPVYRVFGPDLKLIEETKFVLPDDPQGYCASWPVTYAPKSQFPGAFTP